MAPVDPKCELCYEPLSSFEELMNYGESGDKTSSKEVSEMCRKLTVPLKDKGFGEGKIFINGAVAGKEGRYPKTLICHDMRGGYGDDRFVNGASDPENYIFRHWLLTDIFVYFAHKFVTIPTLGWINAGHSHGVKILGTIITEWDDGAEICNKFLASEEAINKTVDKLCAICDDYGFDGYLLNIENKLEAEQVEKMVEFVRKLREGLRKKAEKNIVIWYDSVTKEGELKWQDCLNESNKTFFDVSDGIFLNYNWSDEKLIRSVEFAGDRKYDVYVGVDCWGRGCWGGGGTNTCLAIDKISAHDLSYAIFAPGWTFESKTFTKYPLFDDELWTKCMPNFHYRFVTGGVGVEDGSPIIYLATDFSRGYGKKRFLHGKEVSSSSWFDLSKLSFQPVAFASRNCLDYDCKEGQASWQKIIKDLKPKEIREIEPSSALVCSESKVFYDLESGFYGGGSIKILNSKERQDYCSPMGFCPVWIPMDIPVDSGRLTVALILIWKSVSVNHQPQVYLELGGSSSKKVLLGSLDALAISVRGKGAIRLKLKDFLPENGLDMEFYFQKNNFDEKEINGWRVSCFLLDTNQVGDETRIKGLRIGAEGDVSLGFLSFGRIMH